MGPRGRGQSALAFCRRRCLALPQAIQMRLSEATAEVDAGRVFMYHDIREMFKKANAGCERW